MSLAQDLSRVAGSTLPLVRTLVLLVLPAIYLASGLFSVGSEQRGVVYRFGEIVDGNIPPGMHYHLPWPIETVEILGTTAVRSMDIEFVQSSGAVGRSGELVTGDDSLIELAYRLQYSVVEPARFLVSAERPEALLRALASFETLSQVAGQSINALLTTGRGELQLRLRQRLQARVDALELGMKITGVQIRRLAPPQKIKGVFEEVAGERAERQKAIQRAQGQRSAELASARAQANQALERARAGALESTERAEGDYAHSERTRDAYAAAPAIVAQRLYQDTVQQVFSRARLKVLSPSSAGKPADGVE